MSGHSHLWLPPLQIAEGDSHGGILSHERFSKVLATTRRAHQEVMIYILVWDQVSSFQNSQISFLQALLIAPYVFLARNRAFLLLFPSIIIIGIFLHNLSNNPILVNFVHLTELFCACLFRSQCHRLQ